MPGFDPTLASPFHMDWLVPLDGLTEDDYSRAVAEKAPAILRAARFMQAQRIGDDPSDIEVRLWVEAACGAACVSITWEPGAAKFGFHLLDESLRERIACVVFHDLPCIDAGDSVRQADAVVDAMRAKDGPAKRRRVPVVERAPFEHGVDP